MSAQFADLIRIAGLTALLAFLWTLSIAFTIWNAHQRSLPGRNTILWVAVVALLPFLGFLFYLAALLAARLGVKRTSATPEPGRETVFRRPGEQRMALPTLVAADLDGSLTGPAQPAHHLNALVVSAGPGQGREYRLDRLPAIIGRGADTAIDLDADLGVSRRHAEVYSLGNTLRIRDLQSTHGTRVNDVLIEDECLHAGDRVQVGLSTLTVKTLEG